MKQLLCIAGLLAGCASSPQVQSNEAYSSQVQALEEPSFTTYEDILSQTLMQQDRITNRYMFRRIQVYVRRQSIGGNALEYRIKPHNVQSDVRFMDVQPFNSADGVVYCNRSGNCEPLSFDRGQQLFQDTQQLLLAYLSHEDTAQLQNQLIDHYEEMEEEQNPFFNPLERLQ